MMDASFGYCYKAELEDWVMGVALGFICPSLFEEKKHRMTNDKPSSSQKPGLLY
jgi:hypothetical protein